MSSNFFFLSFVKIDSAVLGCIPSHMNFRISLLSFLRACCYFNLNGFKCRSLGEDLTSQY